jgi:hypothetical protein
MDEAFSPGAEMLRSRRGDQRVTFSDIADHLEDYQRRRPKDAEVIERLAAFLATVEMIHHDHDVSPGSSITG